MKPETRLTIVTAFERRVAEAPDAVAVTDERTSLTYAELNARANRLARLLIERGAGPEMLVALAMPRSADVVVAIVGVLKSGAAYVPIDPAYPRDRVSYLVADSRPLLTVTPEVLAESASCADTDPRVTLSPWHPAYVIYTSGSTGRPKGVVVPHGNVIRLLDATEGRFGFTSGDVWTLFHSYAFDFSVWEIWGALLYGGRLVVVSHQVSRRPDEFLELLAAQKVTVLNQTPSAFYQLMAADRADRAVGERLALRYVIFGGEALELGRLADWYARHGDSPVLVNMYGITETTVHVSYLAIDAEFAATAPGSMVGEAIAHLAMYVLDERLRPLAVGVAGDLYVAGAGLARGYLNRPGLTAARFVANPFGPGRLYRTGDVARWRLGGRLEYLGRSDDQVQLRGFRIELGEVQQVLADQPGVADAVAIVRQDRLLGYVVGDVDPEVVRVKSRDMLPPYMVPSAVMVLDALPLTSNAKLDKTALPEPAVTAAVSWEPRTAAESTVIAAWTEALGHPPRDLDEDLFAAEGTSLTAARLAAALGLRVAQVFAQPNVADLARCLELAGETATATVREIGPLAPGQHRLRLLHQLDPDDTTYHVPTLLRLRGQVRPELLRNALTELVARHDALRMAIETGPDGPRLRVAPPLPVPWEEDVAVEEFVRRPFRLADPPLLRAALVRHERHCDLLIVVHHIVFDLWSARVLLAELGEVYSALAADQPPRLPDPPSYAIEAACEAARLERVAATQIEFWRRVLADPPPPLKLPAGARGAGSRRLELRLPVDVSRFRSTPFVVLLSAFAALLSRWSGQRDLVVGVPFGDRDLASTQALIGFGVRTLPLRITLSEQDTFTTLTGRVRRVVAEALANADLPFDQIVHELGLAGGGDRNPLFRVWFNYLGAPLAAPDLAGLDVEVVELDPPGALFDLGVYVVEEPAGFRISLVYDAAHFDRAHLSALVEQYRLLLTTVCAAPDEPVSTVGLRTEPVTLPDLRGEVPDLVTTLAEVRAERHREVYAAAGALAGALCEAGVRHGDVVPVYARRVPALVPTLLGVLGSGAAFTVLDAELPNERLAHQTRVARARIGVGTGVPAQLRAVCPQWIELPAGGAQPWPAVEPTPDQPAYLAFTSGSTGEPAGVVGTAAPLAHFLSWYTARHQLGADDRFALLAGLSHDPALRDALVPLWVGGALCVPPDGLLRRPADLLAWLAAEAVTVLHVTPALCRLLATAARPLPAVRLVCSSGDALYAEDVARIRSLAPHAMIVNGYGSTETPQLVGHNVIEAGPLPVGPLPVGSGAPGAQLLVRTSSGADAAVGELGEIVVRGPYLASQLLVDPQRLAADPVPGHRCYRTGDLGRQRPDGTVVVTGRADSQVTIRGFRIELAEVDRWLRAQPEVHDAAAGVESAPDGEHQLVAYLVGEPTPAVEVLRARLRTRLPEYMLPVRVAAAATIPLTVNGKVDRSRLAEVGKPVTAPITAPVTALERRIAQVWRQVLATEAIGLDQNFFDLGASSLLMARAQQALEAALGRELPITALFEHTTVRDLARHLAGSAAMQRPRCGPSVRLDELRAHRLAARGKGQTR